MSEKKPTYTTRRFHDPLDDFLDRPIAFNPAFKKITGSTVAALMLSQAWYWSKRTSDEDGWFYKTQAEWEDETGLTRTEYETARRKLKDLGVMEEDLRGVPATLYYRIDKYKIYEMMGVQIAETLQTGFHGSCKQDSMIPANINKESENTTENTTNGTDVPNVPLSIEWQMAGGVEKIVVPTEEQEKQAKRLDFANWMAMYTSNQEEARNIAMAFQNTRQIELPESKVKGQRKAIKGMLEMGVKAGHVVEATKQLMEKGMTVTDLFSVSKTAIDIANERPSSRKTDDRSDASIRKLGI